MYRNSVQIIKDMENIMVAAITIQNPSGRLDQDHSGSSAKGAGSLYLSVTSASVNKVDNLVSYSIFARARADDRESGSSRIVCVELCSRRLELALMMADTKTGLLCREEMLPGPKSCTKWHVECMMCLTAADRHARDHSLTRYSHPKVSLAHY